MKSAHSLDRSKLEPLLLFGRVRFTRYEWGAKLLCCQRSIIRIMLGLERLELGSIKSLFTRMKDQSTHCFMNLGLGSLQRQLRIVLIHTSLLSSSFEKVQDLVRILDSSMKKTTEFDLNNLQVLESTTTSLLFESLSVLKKALAPMLNSTIWLTSENSKKSSPLKRPQDQDNTTQTKIQKRTVWESSLAK